MPADRSLVRVCNTALRRKSAAAVRSSAMVGAGRLRARDIHAYHANNENHKKRHNETPMEPRLVANSFGHVDDGAVRLRRGAMRHYFRRALTGQKSPTGLEDDGQEHCGYHKQDTH